MNDFNFLAFESMAEAEKISIFDGGVSLDLFISEKSKRRFLQDIIEADTNHYLRKRAVELLASMCVFGETLNYSAAVAVLKDIEADDDRFVLCAKIKCLSLLVDKFGIDDESITSEVDGLRFHIDIDVSAQANYDLGVKSLLDAGSSVDRLDFFEKIHLSKKLFRASSSVPENRIDADILESICSLIAMSSLPNFEARDEHINSLQEKVNERRMSYIYLDIPRFEFELYESVQRLCEIICQNVPEWTHLAASLSGICHLHYSIVDQELFGLHKGTNSKFAHSLAKNVLDPFYVLSLKQSIPAVRIVGLDAGEGSQLHEYCEGIIALCQNDNATDELGTINLLVPLSQAFSEIPTSQLSSDLKKCDQNDPAAVMKLICKYKIESDLRESGFVTGTSVGEEILDSVMARLDEALPNYDFDRRSEFKLVLALIIRYVVIASKQKTTGKSFLNFLFNSKAVENDLQDSMLAYIQMQSETSDRYRSEVTEVADGGRVDILYQNDSIIFPIELKKTNTKPNEKSISEKYLSQAQTYTYPYNQLGIFVVLDNSDKSKAVNRPPNDIRELFSVRHMAPYYELGGRYPDHVVTVIVPGNRVTPSERSTYT